MPNAMAASRIIVTSPKPPNRDELPIIDKLINNNKTLIINNKTIITQ